MAPILNNQLGEGFFRATFIVPSTWAGIYTGIFEAFDAAGNKSIPFTFSLEIK